MTEYDYSEEGQRRFRECQSRVSKWVWNQADYAREYDSPFVPRPTSTPATTTITTTSTRHHHHQYHYREHDRDHHSSSKTSSRHASPSPHSSSRRTVHRSLTLPPTHTAVVQSTSHPAAAPQARHTRSHSQSQSRSHAPQYVHPPDPPQQQQQQPIYQYQQAYYPNGTTNISPVAYAPRSGATYGQGRTYQTYSYDPNSQIVLPPAGPGGAYVIVPPAGRKVEVVYEPSRSRYSSRTQQAVYSGSSPTKKQGKPLLKRLLTLGGSSAGNQNTLRRDRRGTY